MWKWKLSDKEISGLLKIGLRPVAATEEPRGDIIGGYLLIPTEHGDKWRNIPDPGWEKSYISLLIYSGNRGAILGSHGAENLWQELGQIE